MQGDRMHDLLPLLQLPLGALHEPPLAPHGVVVRGPRERPPELGDLPARLVDRDDVPRVDFLLGEGLDHLGPQVVEGLHLGGLEGDFPGLGSGCFLVRKEDRGGRGRGAYSLISRSRFQRLLPR